jgi:hypothetical protein
VPASYLMMVLSVQAGIELNPWAVIVSPAACYIGFEVVTRLLPKALNLVGFQDGSILGS